MQNCNSVLQPGYLQWHSQDTEHFHHHREPLYCFFQTPKLSLYVFIVFDVFLCFTSNSLTKHPLGTGRCSKGKTVRDAGVTSALWFLWKKKRIFIPTFLEALNIFTPFFVSPVSENATSPTPLKNYPIIWGEKQR